MCRYHYMLRRTAAIALAIALSGATAPFVVDAASTAAAGVSVVLDGVSLTVNEFEGDRFSILLIPHTLAVTTWGERKAGDELNIEVDQMARYAARLVEART